MSAKGVQKLKDSTMYVMIYSSAPQTSSTFTKVHSNLNESTAVQNENVGSGSAPPPPRQKLVRVEI